jgi:hypothetical protein
MTDIIQQAADVILHTHRYGTLYDQPKRMAQALTDAGLLVTPEQRAVLDAAEAWADGDRGHLVRGADLRLIDAVDALDAATTTESTQ